MLVIPSVDFVRAYSGTAYLLQELHTRGVPVKVAIRTTPPFASEYRSLPYPCELWTYWSPQWGFLRRLLAGSACRMWILAKMLTAKHILITDSLFLTEAALVKRLRGRGVTLIQFCQELQLITDYPSYKWARVYNVHARAPDYVIDVDASRADIRVERMGLARKPYVLRNTLPLATMPKKSAPGQLSALGGGCTFGGRPVVLYTGGTGKERPLERVIDAVALSGADVYFLAFCSAPAAELERLSCYAAAKLPVHRHRICPPVKRAELLATSWEADIGVVDYTYSVEPTLNQKYCAPTKLYEYMACGLAVLGSNNDNLRSIVEAECVGLCARDDSVAALAQSLAALVADPARLSEMKSRAASCFASNYAWECICSPVVARLVEEIGLMPRST